MTVNALTIGGLAAITRDRELEDTVRALAADVARWTPLVRFAEPRVRLPLPSAPGIEARLLTWAPGQGSGLHDHGGSAGCFLVVRASVWETVVDYDGGVHEVTHAEGDVASFERDIIHDIRNEGTVGAVTIHAYRPALAQMTQYVLEDGVARPISTLTAGEDY